MTYEYACLLYRTVTGLIYNGPGRVLDAKICMLCGITGVYTYVYTSC